MFLFMSLGPGLHLQVLVHIVLSTAAVNWFYRSSATPVHTKFTAWFTIFLLPITTKPKMRQTNPITPARTMKRVASIQFFLHLSQQPKIPITTQMTPRTTIPRPKLLMSGILPLNLSFPGMAPIVMPPKAMTSTPIRNIMAETPVTTLPQKFLYLLL